MRFSTFAGFFLLSLSFSSVSHAQWVADPYEIVPGTTINIIIPANDPDKAQGWIEQNTPSVGAIAMHSSAEVQQGATYRRKFRWTGAVPAANLKLREKAWLIGDVGGQGLAQSKAGTLQENAPPDYFEIYTGPVVTIDPDEDDIEYTWQIVIFAGAWYFTAQAETDASCNIVP